MRSRKLLLVHHFPLSSVTGVTIMLSEMLKLVPPLDPKIEIQYLHFEGISDAKTLERALDEAFTDAALVVGVNLHIEVQWGLSVALARWCAARSIPLCNNVQDYWPHHKENLRRLVEQLGVQLVGASPFIVDSLAAENFSAALWPMGAQIPAFDSSVTRAEPKIVASIGRLVRRKRFPDVVRAFRSARLDGAARLKLTLIPSRVFGSEYDGEQLRFIREEMGTASSIELVTTPVIPPDYSGLSVYVAASDYEGFGMMPFEAAYCGCPPIVSDIPPHRAMAVALFGERADDFLYPVTDTNALADRLRDEIASGSRCALLRRRQQEIRSVIERDFSVRTTARALVKLFHESIGTA